MTGPHVHSHTQARKLGDEIPGHSLTQALHVLTGRRYAFGTFQLHTAKPYMHKTAAARACLNAFVGHRKRSAQLTGSTIVLCVACMTVRSANFIGSLAKDWGKVLFPHKL